MKFAIIVHEPASEFSKRNDPALAGSYWASYSQYAEEMAKAGVAAGGAGLDLPQSAKVLTIRNGKKNLSEVALSSTGEQIGGYFVIDVKNMEEALEWAAKCPAATTGKVEVRPLLVMPN